MEIGIASIGIDSFLRPLVDRELLSLESVKSIISASFVNSDLVDGSHKHVSRRIAVANGSSDVSNGKPGKRANVSGYGSHEKAKVSVGIVMVVMVDDHWPHNGPIDVLLHSSSPKGDGKIRYWWWILQYLSALETEEDLFIENALFTPA
ncbi:hypothetical protein V6N11_047491 [Hibiscus sabdariffa]|uniref:Uncharacterized protein n=1 Tax=Hibiscus sabdariffa TaxID=183260 RepID=A0ABR2NKM1_9ROSI